MSHSSTITVIYKSKNSTFLSLLEALLSTGWNLDDHGGITFISSESEDESDWKRAKLSDQNKVFEEISEKEKRGELIGVVVVWENFGLGCSVLYQKQGTIRFLLNINRKLAFHASRFTDVTWYIDRLLPVLSTSHIGIESVTWTEHVS